MSTDDANVTDLDPVDESTEQDISEPQVLPCLTRVPGGVPDLDATLRVAEEYAKRAGLPIRMRIAPDFYARGRRKQQYEGWKGVVWFLSFATTDQVKRFREDLDGFIRSWVDTEQLGANTGADGAVTE